MEWDDHEGTVPANDQLNDISNGFQLRKNEQKFRLMGPPTQTISHAQAEPFISVSYKLVGYVVPPECDGLFTMQLLHQMHAENWQNANLRVQSDMHKW